MPLAGAVPGPNSSAMAVKGIAAPGGKRGSTGLQHPYASAGQGGYERGDSDYGGYRSGQATPAPVMTPAAGQSHNGVGVSNGDFMEDEGHRNFSLLRFLTCRCG